MSQPSARPMTSAPTPDGAAASWVACAELISLCARLLRQVWAKRAGPRGVGETQFSLLWLCRLAPETGVSQSQIAAALALSPAQVSAQVEQLRSAGFLVGRRDLGDRRRQLWRLTPQGRGTVEVIVAELGPWVAACEARLGTGEHAALCEALRALAEVLAQPAVPHPTLVDGGGPRLSPDTMGATP